MADQKPIGPELERRGWATGRVILAEDAECLLKRPTGESIEVAHEDWLVVVSQTCDVVAQKLASEPWLELLHCHAIRKLRSPFKGLRSTRYLDFKPNHHTHPETVVTAHATKDRYFVPRERLLCIAPDSARRLSEDSVLRVQSWFALRYSRPAWPSVFVRRVSPAKDRLSEILQPLRDDVEVRVALQPNDEELDPGESYKVVVLFVVDGDVWQNQPELRDGVHEASMHFVSCLNSCDGVEVDEDESGPVSGDEFTWQATKLTDEWNFANLSFPDPA